MRVCLLTLVCVLQAPVHRVAGAGSADVVVVGRIWSPGQSAPSLGGFAVEQGRITYVGTQEEVRSQLRPGGRVIESPPGGLILPGLVDAHVHMLDGGLLQQRCALTEADGKTRETLFAAIARYAAAHPEERWVMGSGWPPTVFEQGAPTKAELDAMIPDRPAVFYGQDGHSTWMNSVALAATGIRKETPDPVGGRIVRDAKGEPTGLLLESAVDLAEAKIPQPSKELLMAGLVYGQKYLHSLGITMVQDANVDSDHLEIYAEAARSGLLSMKVVAALATDPTRPVSQVDDLVRLRARNSVGNLRADTAKVFVDGVLESRTGALLKPYEGTPEERGILRWDHEVFVELIRRLDQAGFQIHLHVLGDRAVREALDALESAMKVNGTSDHRHQLAHLQLVDSKDLTRIGRLGLIANFQPYWMYADASITTSILPILGSDRTGRLYPIRSVVQGGARLALGSDWPVSTPNPFLGMEVGVTRQAPEPPRGAPWIPEERMPLDRLLTAYTIGGAYANHREAQSGSLELGKAADFIVIDRNPFAIPTDEIGQTRVLATFVDGREVFTSSAEALSRRLPPKASTTQP